ncbi:hypothetical protein ACHHYP_03425 [Achlya hypogyna]|uniref:Transmembrane protein n=1 Tax=Achlya hypogyna TaxID=1202772 RepID=A0A1V9ZRC5_ACHHY|nr:hypothetical protein ACHHYP_03425 [Achlya hypogyna]
MASASPLAPPVGASTSSFPAQNGLVALHDIMNALLDHARIFDTIFDFGAASDATALQYKYAAVLGLGFISVLVGVRGYKLTRAIVFVLVCAVAYVLCPPLLLEMEQALELRVAFSVGMGLLLAYLQSVGIFGLWTAWLYYMTFTLLPPALLPPLVHDAVALYGAVLVAAALAKFARGPDNAVILILQTAPLGAGLVRFVATRAFPTVPALRWTFIPLMYVFGFLQMKHLEKSTPVKQHAD